ncbi:MAG: hypothetical protein NZ700_00030 [Gemmataceae bacterium]|nr:hypothetical protein [Gemmataceae bacterium]MDW8266167.1 hypothetical protein [Gemmataceae bacterium]
MHRTFGMTAGLLTIAVAGCQEAGPVCADGLATGIELRLIAHRDTYTLNLAGLAPEEAVKRWQDVNDARQPSIPTVDLSLELRNHASRPVTIPERLNDWYTLKLEGPGAIDIKRPGMWCIPAPRIIVEAGKSVSVPLNQIAYFRGSFVHGCWLRPGEYILAAEGEVQVDGKVVRLRSNPVRLKVVGGEQNEGEATRPATGW